MMTMRYVVLLTCKNCGKTYHDVLFKKDLIKTLHCLECWGKLGIKILETR